MLDLLDKHRVTRTRLFREACVQHKGNFVKVSRCAFSCLMRFLQKLNLLAFLQDLSKLGRDMKGVVIIDNSPASYLFHPHHAVPIDSWFDDMNDTELLVRFFCLFHNELVSRGVLT